MRAISLSCRKRVRARAICVSGGRGLRSSREKAWRVCWTVSATREFGLLQKNLGLGRIEQGHGRSSVPPPQGGIVRFPTDLEEKRLQ